MASTAVGQGGRTQPRSSRSRRGGTSGCTSRGSATTPHAPLPIIVSGEGCYVYDADGKRYLDGLSALYCVNAGHGRAELAEAAATQLRELDFFTTWSYAHPRAIELATRDRRARRPATCNRVFFTSGGSEAVESALKLGRAYHRLTGNAQKTKIIAREVAYHGTTLGALSVTGITSSARSRSSRSRRAAATCRTPTPTAGPRTATRCGRPSDRRADRVRGARDRRRGDPRAGAERRRLHPAAGRLLPAGARDLRRATTCC